MADGELAAVFKGLAKDAGEAAGKIAESMAKLSEQTADIEENNVAKLLETDAKSADDIAAIDEKESASDATGGANGAGGSTRPTGTHGSDGVRALTADDLNSAQVSNLNRYLKKLPTVAEDTTISGMPDGSVQFDTRVPGRVPGSYALYTKTVGEDGATIGYTKTTVVPDGSIAHIKDKMR